LENRDAVYHPGSGWNQKGIVNLLGKREDGLSSHQSGYAMVAALTPSAHPAIASARAMIWC
jgi:hypothetical protein